MIFYKIDRHFIQILIVTYGAKPTVLKCKTYSYTVQNILF